MNPFLNPHNNGPSVIGTIDINGIFIFKSDISAAEPYGVQIAET